MAETHRGRDEWKCGSCEKPNRGTAENCIVCGFPKLLPVSEPDRHPEADKPHSDVLTQVIWAV
jgi:hypothetical protein